MRKAIKFLFVAGAFLASSSAMAGDDTPPPDTEKNLKIIFWGTESSKHPTNPCKGSTTRKCAEIEIGLQQKSDHVTVTRTLINENGTAGSPILQDYNMTMDQVLDYLFQNLPKNAEIELIN